MTTPPDPASTEPAHSGDDRSDDGPASPARRIRIGTQRPGESTSSLGPRVQQPVPPSPRSAAVGDREAPAPVADAPAPAEPAGAAASSDRSGPHPKDDELPRRRDRRRGGAAGGVPEQRTHSRRIEVPNIRAALDSDLEADFEAAVEGLAIDELLDSGVTAKAEAPIDPGTRVTATVVAVGPDTAFVDLGGRRQGAMKLAGLVEAGIEIPEVGSSLEVSVGARNDEDNLYDVALANRAVAIEDWSQIQAGMIVEARVTAANKGGLECDVAGLRGFMPASLVSTWRVENLEELVGQTLESLVTEIAPAARRLVLSRRAVIEKQAADARARMLETLEPGAEFDGVVRSVREFGAFVDLGDGVEGLVHVSELSWDRVATAADVLEAGQRVRVVVKKVDRQTGRIGLSVRDLVESPWKRAAETYAVGSTVRGVVTRIAQFGAFVKLEPGVEGLVHVSEMAHRRIRHVSDVAREGQQVECRVIAVDPEEQRLSLSIKAATPSPAASDPPPAEAADSGEPAPPPAASRRTVPLKGGVGDSRTQGERFGLRW